MPPSGPHSRLYAQFEVRGGGRRRFPAPPGVQRRQPPIRPRLRLQIFQIDFLVVILPREIYSLGAELVQLDLQLSHSGIPRCYTWSEAILSLDRYTYYSESDDNSSHTYCGARRFDDPSIL